jgi:hypothetical protein
MTQALDIVLLITAIAGFASMAIMPWVILHKLERIADRIHHLEYAVSCLDSDEGPDDDPGEGEPDEVPSNVIAYGRRH